MNYIYDTLTLAKILEIPHNDILDFIRNVDDSFKINFNIIKKNEIPIKIETTEEGKNFIILRANSTKAKKLKINIINRLKEVNPKEFERLKPRITELLDK